MVHRELLLEVMQFTLRGNEHRRDDEREPGDHERPTGIEAKQRGAG